VSLQACDPSSTHLLFPHQIETHFDTTVGPWEGASLDWISTLEQSYKWLWYHTFTQNLSRYRSSPVNISQDEIQCLHPLSIFLFKIKLKLLKINEGLLMYHYKIMSLYKWSMFKILRYWIYESSHFLYVCVLLNLNSFNQFETKLTLNIWQYYRINMHE
jgi:hypothetical protein